MKENIKMINVRLLFFFFLVLIVYDIMNAQKPNALIYKQIDTVMLKLYILSPVDFKTGDQRPPLSSFMMVDGIPAQ